MTGTNVYGNSLVRVSSVCDAISRLESDGLVFAGGSWAAQRAQSVIKEVLDGTWAPCNKFIELYGGSSTDDYLKSDWFRKEVSGGVAQMQQSAADRGTLTNIAWDLFWEHPSTSVSDAMDYLDHEIKARSTAVDLQAKEYEEAVSLGLIDRKDKDARPERKYQAHLSDVEPFVFQLYKWLKEQTIYDQARSQFYLEDPSLGICGTCDSVGLWDGETVVLDLKTSTSAQPKRSHRAQLWAYASMLRMAGIKAQTGVVLIVTAEGVTARRLTPEGLGAGQSDFLLAYSALKNSSLAGSFESANSTTKQKVLQA